MEGTAILGRLTWLLAKVVEVVAETPRVVSIALDVSGWPGHLPGQHVDIRLTAEDGYQAQRSYSIAAPEDGERVVITVEEVDDGEVSPFLVDELRVGDAFELRGPIGGYFVWTPERGGPLQLLAGGSGVVPLMAMIRAGADHPVIATRLLYSAKTLQDIIYRDELDGTNGVEVSYALTRAQPKDWHGYGRRVDRAMLEESTWSAEHEPLVYVCGPTGFVETVADLLVEAGHRPENIRTERFGPSGGSP
jgi:ferredoxin-NADP reductase